MRIVRWVAGLGAVALLVLAAPSLVTLRELPWWAGLAPYALYAVLATVQVVRTVLRGAPARRAVAPGLQGLGDVQDMFLGRPQGLAVSYGSDEPQASALVVRRPDPLDAARWTVTPRPGGRPDVEADPGRPGVP